MNGRKSYSVGLDCVILYYYIIFSFEVRLYYIIAHYSDSGSSRRCFRAKPLGTKSLHIISAAVLLHVCDYLRFLFFTHTNH